MLFHLFSNMKLLKKLFNKNSIKTRGAMLVGATIIANFFNFVYNAYLGRSINIEDFATISLLGSIFGLADLPINALGRSVTYKSAYFLGMNKVPAKGFWLYMRRKGAFSALIVTFLWLALLPVLYKFFQLDSMLPLLAISPIWFFGILSSVDGGFIKGNLNFGRLALVGIADSFIKLSTVIFLAENGFGKYVYLGLPISAFVTFAMVAFLATHLKIPEKVSKKRETYGFPFKFFTASAVTKASATIYLTADIILAKHFLPAEQAGQYALLSLTGKIVYFAGSLFSQFILPMVSHGEGMGKNSHRIFMKLLTGTFLSSFAAFVVMGLFGSITMPLLFGERVTTILPYVLIYSGGMVAFTIATNIIAYHQIKKFHLLPVIGFVLAVLELLALSLFHENVGEIALSVSILGFVSLFVSLFFHIMHGRFVIVWSNILDFFDLFKKVQVSSKGTRILIFNWRDTKHLWAGGAEAYIQALASEWIKAGHHVAIFCGNDGKSKRNETVGKIRVIRRGGFYTVYLWAALYYLFQFRRNYDIIIDSENGIPFFSPLFSRKPLILLIHHVHQEIFMQHLKFPFSYLAKFMEGKLMPLVYKNRTVVTVSNSSKEEIVRTGLAPESLIRIVNPGIKLVESKSKKSQEPTFLYLGRLKPYKNIDIAIKAFGKVLSEFPNARLLVAGEGESKDQLVELTGKLGIYKKVSFLGKVSEQMKVSLLSQSWVALQPSQIEGWGITVLEANAHKTPVIASRVNGLKDSIIDNKTGLLVEVRNIKALENAMLTLLKKPKLRKNFSENAYLWAKNFSWEKNAESFYEIIALTLEKKTTRKWLPNISLTLFNKS